MITPKITGAIITAIIIVIGIALLYPALRLEIKFTADNQIANNQSAKNQTANNQMVLLTFNIVNSSNLPSWCNELSKFLQAYNVHSTIFMTGAIADTYPTCVTSFGPEVDIGSSSYAYNNITSIPDYIAQLDVIKQGKKSIDSRGMINSTLFRAPHGDVDDNIFSQLARSQVVADFSYSDHYNLYINGTSGKTFYRFPLITLSNVSELQKIIPNPNVPLMINFYNYEPIRSIEDILNSTHRFHYQFQSASELTRMNLTRR